MSKTIRRDTLLRLAKAGRLVAIGSYHYDDNGGSERFKGEKPVRVSEHGGFKEGFFHVLEWDFKSSSGMAWQNDDGTVHLSVHGNCSYDFRIVGEARLGAKSGVTKSRRPENARMQQWLKERGIEATVKYLPDGSMRGCWRLYNPGQSWNMELAEKLNGLGFTDFEGEPLGQYSGNGGSFSVFVRGHNELLKTEVEAIAL